MVPGMDKKMNTKESTTNRPGSNGNGNGSNNNKKNGKPHTGNTGVKGNHINMKSDKSITIWTNYKTDNTNNDRLMEYNKLQVGDTRKEATARLEVQLCIKVAGVWDLQEEVRHCLATTATTRDFTQYRHVQQQSPK